METSELTNKLEVLIEDAKAGILATTDSEGLVHMRWMTPIVLKQRPGAVFAFSAPDAGKIDQITTSGRASWMIQTRDLREIVNLSGAARIVDNPALKAELMDVAGARLTVFWKTNIRTEEFVIIETVIEKASWFKPMQATRQTVRF